MNFVTDECINVAFTSCPKSSASLKKFNTVKPGDIVWLVGGFNFYDITPHKSSYGRRCRVKEVTKYGFMLTDLKSNELVESHVLITKASILKELKRLKSEEARTRLLTLFTLEEGDLAEEPVTQTPAQEKPLSKLTKAELLAMVDALNLENQTLKKKYIGPFTLD